MLKKLLFPNWFDEKLYLNEMSVMIEKGITRLQSTRPDFKIYTASIWTDPDAAASSINFDSKDYSISTVQKLNDWNKKYYDQYIAEENLEQAALFKPIENTRACNPASFELRDFETTTYNSFPKNWESKTKSKCWKKLKPALIKIGDIYFNKISKLNIEKGFELSINSEQDWYDITWQ